MGTECPATELRYLLSAHGSDARQLRRYLMLGVCYVAVACCRVAAGRKAW